jgi:hypothetical protein
VYEFIPGSEYPHLDKNYKKDKQCDKEDPLFVDNCFSTIQNRIMDLFVSKLTDGYC